MKLRNGEISRLGDRRCDGEALLLLLGAKEEKKTDLEVKVMAIHLWGRCIN